MNRHHKAELEQRLAGYDAVDFRAILLHLAERELCTVVAALDWADWHIHHPELCSRHVPGLEEHTERARRALAEAGRTGAGAPAAPVRNGGAS